MVRGTNPTSSAVYSIELEAQAQAWIEEVTGEAFQGEFAEELRDGRRLCNLVNAIKPGFVRRVNNSPGMPFKQMENISNFLKACRVVGVPEYSLFETVDLFELKDLGLVVKCLVSKTMRASGSLAFLAKPEIFCVLRTKTYFFYKCWVYLLFIASCASAVVAPGVAPLLSAPVTPTPRIARVCSFRRAVLLCVLLYRCLRCTSTAIQIQPFEL